MYNLRIVDLPSNERPRERLVEYGVAALSSAELIALLLGTGDRVSKLSAVGLGQHILSQLGRDRVDPISRLRDVSAQELQQIHGIGLAKATTIVAAIELGKRAFQSKPFELEPISNPQQAVAYFSHALMWSERERFAILCLDVKHRPISSQVMTIGTTTQTLVSPRDLFQEIIRQGATRAIVAHNHPSGKTDPSLEDLDLTRNLLQGGIFLQLPIVDHLILGCGNWCSLRQTTQLWNDYPQGD